MGQPVRKKALILGADGMLGHRVLREFRDAGVFDVCGTIRKDFVELPTYHKLFEDPDIIIDNLDAGDLMLVQHVISRLKPDIIVNCIGIIKQREEDAGNRLLMTRINQELPHILNEEMKLYGGKLITVSSDCVFLGDKSGAYTEEDQGDAYSIYGRTKYLGEVVDQKSAITLRTSFIGFEVKGFTSLLEWFMSAVNRQREDMIQIRGFTQAVWSGVTTRFMAELIHDIAIHNLGLSGLYHIASEPMTKYELLSKLSEAFGLEAHVERDSLYIPDKVCNRWLSCLKFPSDTGIKIPSWDELMVDLVEDYKFYKAHRE